MIKRIIIPPYDEYDLSTFVINNDTVYIGHFGGYCDESGNLLTTVAQQMEQTMKNLEEALKSIHLTLDNIVKMTVILKSIEDFHKMHSVWVKYFSEGNYPVRSVITSDFISERCLVQIEGIACYKSNE